MNTELKVLERAGLLVRVAHQEGERRVWLVRQKSTYWTFCQEARDTLMRSTHRIRKRDRGAAAT